MTRGGQRGRQIDRGRGLADPALLVGDGDDPGAACGRKRRRPASTPVRLTATWDQPMQTQNHPPRIGDALVTRRNHCPVFARQGQFFLGALAFWQQADGAGAEKRPGQTSSRSSGAQARAVTTSTGCGGSAAIRHGRIVTLALGDPRRLAQKRGICANRPRPARPRARRGSPAPGPETRRRCRDRPGFARHRESSGSNCAESRMCRRHRSASVSRPTRLMRSDQRVSRPA